MRKILLLLTMAGLWFGARGQCPPVTGLATTTVSATTASFVWTPGTGGLSGPGQSFGVTIFRPVNRVTVFFTRTYNTFASASGLLPSTLYRLYVRTTCPDVSQTQSTIDSIDFTTSATAITYTPMTAAGYQYKYVKVDSGLAVPYGVPNLGRGVTRPGSLYMSSTDSLMYYYNGVDWKPFIQDSSGIAAALAGKVDSVTLSHDSLFYWKGGVSYGYLRFIPSSIAGTVGGAGGDDPTTGASIYVNAQLVGLKAKIVVLLDGVQLASWGLHPAFTFDPLTGTVDISPAVFIVGSYLFINTNQY